MRIIFVICILNFLSTTILIGQWEIIHQNKWDYFTSLDLVNDSIGYATANGGQIIKTTDGGKTWENFVKLGNPVCFGLGNGDQWMGIEEPPQQGGSGTRAAHHEHEWITRGDICRTVSWILHRL